MRTALTAQIAETEAWIVKLDLVEQRRAELALRLQQLRRDWIDSELAADESKADQR